MNPMAITMIEDESVTANFIVSFGEPVPWVEDSDGLATGITNQGWPTSWTTARGGIFRVVADRLEINGSGGEGVFTSSVIDISGGSVNLSLSVQGAGGLDASGGSLDYVRWYIKINGGPETLIKQVSGALAATTWTTNGITGTSLQIVIRALVTASDEFYYLDDLRITNIARISPTVNISQPATGAVFAPGANLLITASASGSDGTIAKVEYFVAGTTKIGESTNAPAFSFS